MRWAHIKKYYSLGALLALMKDTNCNLELLMKEIDIETWERKEHFQFFSNSDLPFYNTCFNLSITGLKEISKELSISFNSILLYITIKSLVAIRNFRFRYENNKVIEYDKLIPSFAHINKGEELFRFITVGFDNDLRTFDKIVKDAIQNSRKYFDLDELKNGTNMVFISSLPWIPFTSIDHTMSLNKFDTIPRISWGKAYNQGEETILPYNIQVNHIFIDGLHVGKFYENLGKEISSILSFRPTKVST